MSDELRAKLNGIYRPLHEEGKKALRIVRGLGYDARLSYCNMHETSVDGEYQTEYFPLPEIEIAGLANAAELGICLDLSAWLEVTLPRERALALDYPALARRFRVEVYGADDYLSDFYRDGMDAGNVIALIRASSEREIHVCFRFGRADEESIRDALLFWNEQP